MQYSGGAAEGSWAGWIGGRRVVEQGQVKQSYRVCARNQLALLSPLIVACMLLLAACTAPSGSGGASSGKQPGGGQASGTGDGFLVVDCLLPGQIRKLGANATYLSPRRPVRTSAADCEIRGGEYVAYDRASYSTALKIWLPLAKEGDASAQTYVGEIYERGLGLAPDYKTAAYWYQLAAAQGDSRAQINLGHLYETGQGVPQDSRKALNLYRQASGIQGDELLYASSLVSTHVPLDRYERVQGELVQSQRSSSALQQQLANANRDLARQASELQRAEVQLSTTESQLTQLVGAGAVFAASPTNPAQVQLQADLARLESQRQDLEVELADLQRQNEVLFQRQGDLSGELNTRLGSEAGTQRKLVELQRESTQAREQLARSERRVAELEASLQQAAGSDSSSAAQLESLRQDLAQTQRQLQTQQRQYTALEAQSKAQKGQLQAASTDQEQAQRSSVAERQRMAAQLAEREQQLADTEHQLLISRAALQMERVKAEQALASANSEHQAAMATEQAQLASLSAQLETQYAEVRRQRKKIDALEVEVASRSLIEAEPEVVLAEASIPPRIEIIEPPVVLVRSMPSVRLAPSDSTREIIGKVDAPEGIVSLSVNGTPFTLGANRLFRATVPIDVKPKPVQVVVVDKQGQRAAVSFTFVSGGKSAAATSTAKGPGARGGDLGDYYALIVGNNEYRGFSTLSTAVNDARATEQILRDKYRFKTRLLLNADRYTILSALNELRETLGENDNLLIYYAGHGVMDEQTQRGYWIPVDADPDNNANWISNTAITDMLSVIKAKHILVVADSCFAGTLTQAPLARTETDIPPDVRSEWIKVMAQTRARITLTSGGLEPVMDGGGGNHSVFAKAFLAALSSNDGVLEGYGLYYELLDRMSGAPAVVTQVPQYAPIHLAGHESGEFFFNPI